MLIIMKAPLWRWLRLLAFIPGMTGMVHATAASLDDLLARSAAPPGVVFEIVDRDPRALEVAPPWVKQASQQLRARFPELPMALVSHGLEMFALQSGARESNAAVHRLAESLSGDDGIPLHVCETYANRRALAAEDFPAYIDVAPEGPAQIRNYEALDYVRLAVPKAAVLKAR